MIHLCVDVEVENHKEIIKNKGKAFGLISSLISNETVEKEIRNEIIKKLEVALANELSANGVKAKISIK
ncbi:MAG: hypothetical protein AB6733_14300 [Clostridiaceae bacterium]